jgi:DnaJ family protein A protein 5
MTLPFEVEIYYYFCKALAKFAQKRDPRYKAHLVSQSKASQPPGSSTAADFLSQRRTQVTEAYVEQEWQRVSRSGQDDDFDWSVAEGDLAEEWECVACRKTFRSEPAWDSHERSKKHIKEAERLRREMEMDDDELGLREGGEEIAELDGGGIAGAHKSASPATNFARDDLRPPGWEGSDFDSLDTKSKTNKAALQSSNKEASLVDLLIETEAKVRDGSIQKPVVFPRAATHGDEINIPGSEGQSKNQDLISNTGKAGARESQPELSKREKRRLREAKRAAQDANRNINQACANSIQTFRYLMETLCSSVTCADNYSKVKQSCSHISGCVTHSLRRNTRVPDDQGEQNIVDGSLCIPLIRNSGHWERSYRIQSRTIGQTFSD